MPLHEYLEQKRLQNIAQLNADGACHICGSNCRNSNGFSQHILGNQYSSMDGPNYCNEKSMVKSPSMAAMRTCSCFGIPETDADYCPSSVRCMRKIMSYQVLCSLELNHLTPQPPPTPNNSCVFVIGASKTTRA